MKRVVMAIRETTYCSECLRPESERIAELKALIADAKDVIIRQRDERKRLQEENERLKAALTKLTDTNSYGVAASGIAHQALEGGDE